jgi:hypothetical protein
MYIVYMDLMQDERECGQFGEALQRGAGTHRTAWSQSGADIKILGNRLNKSTIKHMRSKVIEEGRAESKSPHQKFGCFLSLSQQGVSANIIQNSAVGNFSTKAEGTNTKAPVRIPTKTCQSQDL